MKRFFHATLGPLFLLLLCPPTAMVVWYTHTRLSGSVAALCRFFLEHGLPGGLARIWGPVFFGSPTAWLILGCYAAFELAAMRLLPGKPFRGPVTPRGNVPVYKANGVPAYGVTMALFCVLSFGLGLFPATIIYDHLGGLLGALNLFSLVFCLFLYGKGRFFPSSSDCGVSGNFIFDYYWGTELFPRVLGFDLKMFTNCRFAMMGWPLILISFAAKQHELAGLSDGMIVAVGLQLVYVTKFFIWETGYLSSLDIMHDRAGFYICWGILVWLPSIYTSSTLYLVHHPASLVWPLALAIAVLGTVAVLCNYFADRQRQLVRATAGQCTVWGKPPEIIVGHYVTAAGEHKESLLLASGYWGITRHFHYLPEILGAFFWTLPVLFGNLLPWFYLVFLTALLTHRAFRDDERCARKYGADWLEYRRRVPHKLIPGLI